ncbi:type I phosphomannose isomerase catalytic subunit [Lachnospiraceae bacterium 54-53]
MQILKPIPMAAIWGGTRLIPCAEGYQGENIGQLYTVKCGKDCSNQIIGGSYAGKTFYEYYQDARQRFDMTFEEYPLLIALVDAKEDLSVQVHPNDGCAQKLEQQPFGKTESWYFLEAPDRGTIVNGCLCSGRDELVEKVSTNDFEHIIDYLEVKKGDYVYVEAGTLHALGGGSMVYEVQENSDLTYRFYDYDRKDPQGNSRPLHIEKALEAVDVGLKSAVLSGEDGHQEKKYWSGHWKGRSCRNMSDRLEMVTVIGGESPVSGVMVHKGVTIVLEPGEKVEFSAEIEAIVARSQVK